ncbi:MULTISPECIES: efflux RND transporter permease subunit [unclassified Oceanispirochaeta]|uniref:efflux RND transporter permease subunit n=1 Tax=unclassified Oceanispirochaeta TaxID=2635722 RepID=UPI000E09D31D|nr:MULTISPECIES: efflux RND transporter permease subunit [unclassified Oceanispirochaeta]MBF9016426.1 efflux RND transporter permease subunit [Oceanispirochaeta sp. M2]NPD72888.1 efflux RND transporter permease subunit [Oceanispirochaeta sp. M1]RDG31465.1 AcrB/AcrD/AcrF family protein [Oceanispirochaeta sp. M1]
MNIAEIAIEKKVITYIVMVLLLVGGFIGFQNMGKLEDPDFTIREVRVITMYPGATPSEVEEEVSDIIEQAAQQLPDVEEVSSESSNGMSIVTVKFFMGINSEEYRQLYDELRRKVNDAQTSLPPGTGPSLVNDDFGDVFGIFYAITGDGFTQKELYDYTEDLEKALLLVPGVSKVELWGVPQEVIYVEISRTMISSMDISEDYLYSLLQDQNMVVSTGSVAVGDSRMIFRGESGAQSVQELGDTVISSSSDSQITLKDIATIRRDYRDPPQNILRYNGKQGIGLGISVMKGGNVIVIGDAITEALNNVIKDTPLGMEVETIMMQGNAVRKSITGFVMNLVQSVVIVIGLLMIFMGLQSGMLIGGMLILIIAGTLLIMYLQGITLQRISLGALIIAMGMLVDNSIVITEGMLVRFQKGEKKLVAANKVVNQQIWPLFGATLVAIFAFASVGMSPDGTGEYTRSLFLVIIISLTLSWVLAITVNPMLAVQFLKPKVKEEDPELIQKDGKLMQLYKGLIKYSIANKFFIVLILACLLALSMAAFQFVSVSFFPKSEQPQFMIDYWLPEGTDIRRTEQDMMEIEEYLMSLEEVKNVSTYVGQAPLRFQLTFSPEKPNSRYGMFLVEVYDSKKIDALFPQLQEHLDSTMVDGMSQLLRFNLGPGSKGAISTRVLGPDSKVVREIAQQIKEIYFEAGAIAITDDWGDPAAVVRMDIDSLQVKRTGLSRVDVNEALQQSYLGKQIGLYRENNKLLPILARPPQEERMGVQQANEIQIWSAQTGRYIPLAQLTKSPELAWEDSRIQRKDRLRAMAVKCDPREGILANSIFEKTRPLIEAIEMPPGYYIEFSGEYEDSKNANEGISKTFPLAFLAMTLTILFLWNKIKQPIIILLSIPLSLIGVIFGLVLTNTSLGFMAILGSLALFGMAIKNAIVMVDEIDQLIKEGVAPYQALLDASQSRLRPVMMATLSTVMGMAPLITDIFFRSMAVAIMFGLSFSAFLTLIVSPTLYAIFFKIDPPEDDDDAPEALTAEAVPETV